MDHLSEKDEAFLGNMGAGGVLLTSACFIQLVLIMEGHWISFTIMAVYLIALASYIMMIKKSAIAPLMLLISAILIFLVEAYLILALTFSLLLLLLLIYSAVTVVLVYTSGIIKKLQRRDLAEKQERDNWKNII